MSGACPKVIMQRLSFYKETTDRLEEAIIGRREANNSQGRGREAPRGQIYLGGLVHYMVVQCSDGLEGKRQVADVYRLHKPE